MRSGSESTCKKDALLLASPSVMDALRSWFLALSIPVVCQSPLDWPPKPSVPPLPTEQTPVRVDWLAGALAAGTAIALDVREAELDVEQVTALLATPGVALLDVRDARGWERWETPPTFAAGHVPHALPFDVDALLDPDAARDPLARVREKIGRHGPRQGDPLPPDSTFIVYGAGAGDPRAAVAYLLLDAAGFEARLLAGGFTAWTAAGRPVVRAVAPADAWSLIGPEAPQGKVNVLDLRDERAFAIGHLPGAVNVPCYDFEREVDAALSGLDRRLPLVLYCYGPGCVRSWNAAPLAARKGFRDILWLRGGTEAWKEAGYPLVESPLPPSGQSLRKQNHW